MIRVLTNKQIDSLLRSPKNISLETPLDVSSLCYQNIHTPIISSDDQHQEAFHLPRPPRFLLHFRYHALPHHQRERFLKRRAVHPWIELWITGVTVRWRCRDISVTVSSGVRGLFPEVRWRSFEADRTLHGRGRRACGGGRRGGGCCAGCSLRNWNESR